MGKLEGERDVDNEIFVLCCEHSKSDIRPVNSGNINAVTSKMSASPAFKSINV